MSPNNTSNSHYSLEHDDERDLLTSSEYNPHSPPQHSHVNGSISAQGDALNSKFTSNPTTPTTTTSSVNMFHTPISDFYRDKAVLITGGSGFVGKVLIEKLLYEFPHIGQIYVLLRSKGSCTIRKRLNELIQCPVFDRIRAHCPQQFQKLVPLNGDISLPGLGINPIDMRTVCQNVSIIFHSAATIRFDEPLKYALIINTLGTKRMIQLAKKLDNLEAFVHVSTAYCTAHKQNIEEKVYPEPISPEQVLQMADWMEDSMFNSMGPIFYRGRPCSYHFTKSLAEQLIAQEVSRGYYNVNDQWNGQSNEMLTDHAGAGAGVDDDDLEEEHRLYQQYWRPFPAAIVRPSIISASWKDPFPGWIDNYNGTTGFLMVVGKGVLRTIHVQPDYLYDLVPVDVVINSCIASAWHVANCARTSTKSKPNKSKSGTVSNDVFVVNCVSGTSNPLTWGQLRDMALPITRKYPSTELFRVPAIRFHRRALHHRINKFIEHTVPAYFVDFIFKFMGFPPVMCQIYQKVHRTFDALEHFTTNEWTYSGNNLAMLDRLLERSYSMHKNGVSGNSNGVSNGIKNKNIPETMVKNGTLSLNYDHHHHQNGHTTTYTTTNGYATGVQHPFALDMQQMDWNEYLTNYVLGIRQYLLKENPDTIPQAKRQLFIIQTLTTMAKLAVSGTVAYQLMYRQSLTRECLELLTTYLTGKSHKRTGGGAASLPPSSS